MMSKHATESDATSEREPKAKSKRRSPTQKQVEALALLDDDALIAKALNAVFALNRRAKKIRDTRNEYRRASFAESLKWEMLEIYAIKDGLLNAMALAGRAEVYVFTVRKYVGCDINTSPVFETQAWYLIDCGGRYRFHQPKVTGEVAALAKPTEPHDPTQPQREIPDIDLTIEAQKTCVRMATERLKAAISAKAA